MQSHTKTKPHNLICGKMLNLLAEWLKKNVIIWLSKKLFAILLYVLPVILYQVNIVTINLSCEYVPNLVQRYTPFPPPWKCDKPTKREDFAKHKEMFIKSESKENVKKANFVKSMFLNAWQHYEEHAWGYNGVRPVTDEGLGRKAGSTIVASMSTLWVMNLTEQFERGKGWILKELNLAQVTRDIQIWNAIPQYIGGLLSCYALTGDRMFLQKASETAQILQPAYASRTSRTNSSCDVYRSELENYFRYHFSDLLYGKIRPKNTNSSESQIYLIYLSEIGTSLLEHIYLFNLTNDSAIEKRIDSAWKLVREEKKPKDLYKNTTWFKFDAENYDWTDNISKLWAPGKDLFLNLLKIYIQSGDQNMEALKLYSDAIETVNINGIFKMNNIAFYANDYDVSENKLVSYGKNVMPFTGCYLSEMYALGADTINYSLMITERSQVVRHMQLARELTEMCHKASVNTETGLTPMSFYLDGNENEENLDSTYQLRPYLAQSYFILWRLTHEQKYRDYAWQMVKAIHQHCRTESGTYSSVFDVNEIPTEKTNEYPMEFLSATLKYLYLTFTPDSVLPLDQWVFNSAGHPLPICGANDAYSKC